MGPNIPSDRYRRPPGVVGQGSERALWAGKEADRSVQEAHVHSLNEASEASRRRRCRCNLVSNNGQDAVSVVERHGRLFESQGKPRRFQHQRPCACEAAVQRCIGKRDLEGTHRPATRAGVGGQQRARFWDNDGICTVRMDSGLLPCRRGELLLWRGLLVKWCRARLGEEEGRQKHNAIGFPRLAGPAVVNQAML